MNPFEDHRRIPASSAMANVASTPKSLSRPNAKSLSRIEGMTVGDVRQCFSQIRTCYDLSANTTLWCGITAGEFALAYLVNTVGSSRKKRTLA
jgi:hypothetical protein